MTTPAPSIASRMGSSRSQTTRGRRAAWPVASALLLAAAALVSGHGDARAASPQEQKALCVACHGETGQSENPDVPHIGGQPKLFVMYQLFFYREGRRKSPEMNTVAKDLSDADLTALSDYVVG